MNTVKPAFPNLSLGSAGLYPDVYGDYELTRPPEGFDFLNSKPRSSVVGADTITFDWDRDGHATKKDTRLEDVDNNPILEAYTLHDYGFFKSRGNDDMDQVLLVPVAYARDADHELQTRGIVRVYLNADPDFRYLEDVPPPDVMRGLEKNKQAADMLLARDIFRMEEREKRNAARQAIVDKAIETVAADGPATPAETAPDKATPAIETPAPVLKTTAVPLTEVAADMSAAFKVTNEAMAVAVTHFKIDHPARPTLLGSIIAYGVLAGDVSHEAQEQLADALDFVTEGNRRIQGVVIEEIRADRWKVDLYCRELEGKVVTAHTVHVTPCVSGPAYRVTGSRKYPHHREVLEYIERSFDAAYHLTV